jgi:hypothetical protein
MTDRSRLCFLAWATTYEQEKVKAVIDSARLIRRGNNARRRRTQIPIRGQAAICVWGRLCASHCKHISYAVAGKWCQVLFTESITRFAALRSTCGTRSSISRFRDCLLVRKPINRHPIYSPRIVGCHIHNISKACSLHSA